MISLRRLAGADSREVRAALNSLLASMQLPPPECQRIPATLNIPNVGCWDGKTLMQEMVPRHSRVGRPWVSPVADRERLNMPQEVRAATDAYREESEPLRDLSTSAVFAQKWRGQNPAMRVNSNPC